MVTITCKCGKTSMTFVNMTAKDFPNGWVTDCCSEVPQPVIVEEMADSPVGKEFPNEEPEAVKEVEAPKKPEPQKQNNKKKR